MTKYNGMNQRELVSLANQLYADFLSTFEKPMELVSIEEVSKAYKKFETTCKELRSLISDERAFWYQYKEYNEAWLNWNNTFDSIADVERMAWEIVETKDWSIYER